VIFQIRTQQCTLSIRRALETIIAGFCWDYIDMGLANSVIVLEKIVTKFPNGSKESIAKTRNDFRRMVAIELIGDFSSRKNHLSTLDNAAASFDTELNMLKSTEGANDGCKKRRKTEKS